MSTSVYTTQSRRQADLAAHCKQKGGEQASKVAGHITLKEQTLRESEHVTLFELISGLTGYRTCRSI
jgi:hypothetical protein